MREKGWEIGRSGLAGNVHIGQRVHGDAVAEIIAGTAQISGIKNGGGIGVERDDKDIAAAGIGRAQETRRVDGREIGRGRGADDKYVAGRVQRHAIADINAEIGAAKYR